jgi:type IX secretion system PorP/SprF family membrane protein
MRETQIALSLAWNKQITKDLRLAVGLRGGLFNYNINLSQLNRDVDADVAFRNNDLNILAPMTGFGIYLYSEKYFVGVSAPRMVFVADNPVNNVDISYATTTQYYAFAGFVQEVNSDWKIKPTTQVKMAQGAPIQVDLNVHAIYKDDYSIGAFYRTGGELGIMAMAQVSPNFTLVYAYDHRLAPVNNYVNGSHEFGVQYAIPYVSNRRVIAPRYF